MLDWFGRKLREMQEVKRDERGFTLIELLVVVIIIGILAAIAIPTFLNQRNNAIQASVVTDARNAASQIQSWGTQEGGDYSTVAAEFDDTAGTTASGDYDIEFSDNNSFVAVPTGTTDGFSFTVTNSSGDVEDVDYDSEAGGIQD